MTFPVVDRCLALRLERAEGQANAEFVTAKARQDPDSGATWARIGGADAIYDGPESPLTQSFGLGLEEPVEADELLALEDFFRDRSAPVFHEVCPIAGEDWLARLSSRGYRPLEWSSVLYRDLPLDSLNSSTTDEVTVRRVESGEEDRWARLVAAGWKDIAPELETFLTGLGPIQARREHSHAFFAERQGELIAAGLMSLFEGVALLGGACTLPEYRRLGAQRALLEHRLRFGAERGCELGMMVAEPGSASQRNAERQGFRVAYTRLKWQLDRD